MTTEASQYRVFVEPLAGSLGGGFAAYAPELKGCISDGATPDEALHNIYDAITCWIEDAISHGEPVPVPAPERRYA